MSTALARIRSKSSLTEGEMDDQFYMLPATRTVNIEGIGPKVYSFLNELGKPKMLVIKNQMTFDKSNPTQLRNWKLLKFLQELKDHENLKEDLELIDQEEDDEREIENTKRRMALVNLILEKTDDTEWLSKVYRQVIGIASGIPAKTLQRALVKRAEEDFMQFVSKSKKDKDSKDKWFFEDEYFENRALLYLSVEKGLLIKDGELFKTPDGQIWAGDEAKALYKLTTDVAYKAYLQDKASTTETVRKAPVAHTIKLENSELINLAAELGESTDTTPLNEDGSVDEVVLQARKEKEFADLVDALKSQDMLVSNGEAWQLFGVDEQFANESELIGYLKQNPEQVKTYQTYLQ